MRGRSAPVESMDHRAAQDRRRRRILSLLGGSSRKLEACGHLGPEGRARQCRASCQPRPARVQMTGGPGEKGFGPRWPQASLLVAGARTHRELKPSTAPIRVDPVGAGQRPPSHSPPTRIPRDETRGPRTRRRRPPAAGRREARFPESPPTRAGKLGPWAELERAQLAEPPATGSPKKALQAQSVFICVYPWFQTPPRSPRAATAGAHGTEPAQPPLSENRRQFENLFHGGGHNAGPQAGSLRPPRGRLPRRDASPPIRELLHSLARKAR